MAQSLTHAGMLTERLFDTPLPTFPVCFAEGGKIPILYHITQKLQYNQYCQMLLEPFLSRLFARQSAVHLLRNGGDLANERHRKVTFAMIDAYGFTTKGMAVFNANDLYEKSLAESHALACGTPQRLKIAFFNANRLRDPAIFNIIKPKVERKYLVCHTARLVSWKRHELLLDALSLYRESGAGESRSLVLSSGVEESVRYVDYLSTRFKEQGIDLMTGLLPGRVNFALNQSFMGAALSEGEGACMAVGEYLLAGLPVLSIRGARGGRNIYLNRQNSVFCNPDPQSVAEGISLIVGRTWDRELIRGEFLTFCLPGGFKDLCALANESAMELGCLPGPLNLNTVDRLVCRSTIKEWGLGQEVVKETVASLMEDMGTLALASPLPLPDGVRLILELPTVRAERRSYYYSDYSSLDISDFGWAAWRPNPSQPARLLVKRQGVKTDEAITLAASRDLYIQAGQARLDISVRLPASFE